jgi:hypothetical protein
MILQYFSVRHQFAQSLNHSLISAPPLGGALMKMRRVVISPLRNPRDSLRINIYAVLIAAPDVLDAPP